MAGEIFMPGSKPIFDSMLKEARKNNSKTKLDEMDNKDTAWAKDSYARFEKRYNEALGWMRKIYPTLTGANKEDAEHYFPELKESEDERIRETLANLIVADINELIKSADSGAYFQGVKEYLEDVRQFAYNKGLVDAMEKQKDAKVVKFDHDREHQPAEWSEEDEKMIDKCIELVLFAMPENISAIKTKDQCITWLKSLRPQPHWKPSEEQMRCLLDCVSKAKEIHNASVGGYDAYRILVSLYDDLHKLL